ncbi:MAG: hypothetical protein R3E77_14435 [Steroidobacteraceae bacterium]
MERLLLVWDELDDWLHASRHVIRESAGEILHRGAHAAASLSATLALAVLLAGASLR